MGFFGFGKASKVDKLTKKLRNAYSQTQERHAVMQQLAELGTEEAMTALLQRFTYRTEASIVDEQRQKLATRRLELEKTKARLTRSRQSTRRQERWQRKKQMASLAREKSVLAEELERHERELQQRSRTSGREREEEWLRRQRHHHRSAVMRPASTA